MAFHPYPQVIPPVCNPDGFGPPRACSARFTLPKGRSPSFGSVARHLPPFRTRVRSGSGCPCLNLATNNHSSAHSTKGTPSHPQGVLRLAGSARFQALFHSPRRGAFHRSLTVLVPYRSLRVFSLGSWSTRFPTRFRVSDGTHANTAPCPRTDRLRDSHPLRSAVPVPFGSRPWPRRGRGTVLPASRSTPTQQRVPAHPLTRFGLLPFRSPLLRESSLFLAVLRCFSSRGLPTPIRKCLPAAGEGLPHSDTPGSPVASTSPGPFAAWPRPSSAAGA